MRTPALPVPPPPPPSPRPVNNPENAYCAAWFCGLTRTAQQVHLRWCSLWLPGDMCRLVRVSRQSLLAMGGSDNKNTAGMHTCERPGWKCTSRGWKYFAAITSAYISSAKTFPDRLDGGGGGISQSEASWHFSTMALSSSIRRRQFYLHRCNKSYPRI